MQPLVRPAAYLRLLLFCFGQQPLDWHAALNTDLLLRLCKEFPPKKKSHILFSHYKPDV